MSSIATVTSPPQAPTNGRAPRPRPEHAGVLEVWKPPTTDVGGHFDLRIEDPEGIEPHNIIKSKHSVRVVCEIWLTGAIWKCVVGHFCCEVWFERASNGERFSLSDLIGSELRDRFVGCELLEKDNKLHFRLTQDVPAKKFLNGGEKPDVFEAVASVSFENECGDRGTVSGFDYAHIQVYAHR